MPDASQMSLERVVNAVEKVRELMLRAAGALARAGVPKAVAGGNAVAAWVSTVDEGAVRNTQDVDILIRRSDFAAVRLALEGAGFAYRHAAGLEIFLDGPRGLAAAGRSLGVLQPEGPRARADGESGCDRVF